MTLMSESKKEDILRLAKKFPSQLVRTIKKGNREEVYINHAVITQRLLQVLGSPRPLFQHSRIQEQQGAH